MNAQLVTGACGGRGSDWLVCITGGRRHDRGECETQQNAEAGCLASASNTSDDSHDYLHAVGSAMQGLACRSIFGIGNSNPDVFTADLKFGSVVHSFTFLPNR